MSHLLNVSKTGLHAFQYELDTVANDVANVNTTGHKARQAEFESLLANNYSASEGLLLGEGVETLSIQGGSRAADYTIDFSQGALVASEGPHQYALAGPGFFQVVGADGEAFYTRDGNFGLDATGSTVVNMRGQRVTMAGDVPAVFRPATAEVDLVPAGENNYRATGAMQPAMTEVLVGQLEQSNVDLATAITDMMMAQRAYALNVKAAQSTDEMMSAINQFKQ